MKNKTVFSAFIILVVACLGFMPAHAGNPHGAYYHWSGKRLFWFMIISDLHVGVSGSQDTGFLNWAVTNARSVITPGFIVATGDLTDSTNGGIIPNGPYQEEWDTYRQILDDAGMDSTFYYDIPGNHDHYNDSDLAYYLANSIQGSANGNTQHAWVKDYPFGAYQFIGTCTAGNDGAPFSFWPWDNFGDNAGLDAGELAFIESQLLAHPEAELSLLFGHHPFDADYYSGADTGLTYGRETLLNLIDTYGISLYGFGHTHNYRENFYYQALYDGVFYINLASLGKSSNNHYSVLAVDANGIAIVPAQQGIWPVVLITAPVDINLGDSPQPFGYAIPQGHVNPIRALVFDNNQVTSVVFCIDGDVSCSEMQPVDGGPLWQGFWDGTTVAAGPHTIVVRAEGSTTAEDRIDTLVNPALCLGDGDRDGDVDGSDLAALIEDYVSPVVLDFVDCFGRTGV